MSEKFPYKKENVSEPSEKKEDENNPSKIEEFFDKESEILNSYGLKGDIKIKFCSLPDDIPMGFSATTRQIGIDTNSSFFKENKYSLKETLFLAAHEIMAHYTDLLKEPELVLKEAKRYQETEHIHLLHNAFEDVRGNRRVVAGLPFLEETKTRLYRERQFPKTDYRDRSSHFQFVIGFLREMMVPNEPVELGEEARQALNKLRAFGEDKIDVLDLVTTPTIEPKERFELMKNIIEPVYLELYQKDIEKEKNKKDSENKKEEPSKNCKGCGGNGKEEQKPSQSPERSQQKTGDESKRTEEETKKKFQKEYKEYNDANPDLLNPEDQKRLKKTLETTTGKKASAPSLDKKIIKEWAKEHSISTNDILEYRKEYKEIAPFVRELRDVFKQIVSRRLKERWKMSPQLETEGETLDEETLAESYIESKAGSKPNAFREIIRSKKENTGYGSLDMTLVNDLSSSMNEGMKMPVDRKTKLLFLESLADFQEEIKEAEYENGVSLGLEVRTEIRAFGDFGDAELKPLSPELSEKNRISIWKKTRKGKGGTPDYLSLEEIERSIDENCAKELKEKKKRKVVVVLSDGESEKPERVQLALENLRKKNVIVSAFGMTSSGQAVKETYKPDTEVIEDIHQLPKAMQKIILKYTDDL